MRYVGLISFLMMTVVSVMPVYAAQTIKDEFGRTIYTIDDEGTVTMFENSPGIDITLSATRGTREEMQPKIIEVSPASVHAASSVVLRLKGKNFVGATVKFDRPGIEISPFANNKPISLEIPIRVAPNMSPGEVTVVLTTPIGSTSGKFIIAELQIGTSPTRRDERKAAPIATSAPASCPDKMVGVAAESGGFCIDLDETIAGDYRTVEKACAVSGKRLCQAMEWRHACEQATTDSLPLKNMLGNWEWTGSWIAALKGDFDDPLTRSILMGKSDCQASMDAPQWRPDSYRGRCCK